MYRLTIILLTSVLSVPQVFGQGQEILYGTVVTEDGRPVPNITLLISGPYQTRTVETGSLGQYQVDGLPGGSYSVSIEEHSYKISSGSYVTVSGGQTRLNVIVASGPSPGEQAEKVEAGSAVLYGTVRTADNVPAPSVLLLFTGGGQTRQVMSGPDGEYRVEDMRLGEHLVEVDSGSFVIYSRTQFRVFEGTNRLDVTLGLHESVSVTAEAAAPSTVTNPGMSTVIVEHEQIEDRQPSTVDLVLRETPGLAVSRQGGVGSPSSVYVRGGASNYALVLIDGFPANDPGGEFDFGKLLPLELEKVEVTRGAASSVHGGALSGVIHMVTRQADSDEKGAYVKGDFGNFSWNRFQGGTSGRSDIFDWNIGAIFLQTDNQEPNSAFEQLGVAATLGVEMGEDSFMRVIMRSETNEAGAPGQTAYVRPDLDASEQQSRLVLGATITHAPGSTEHEFRGGLTRTNKLSLNPEDSGPIDLEPVQEESGELTFRVPDFASADGLKNDTQRVTLAYKAAHQTQRHLITAGGELENQNGVLGSEAVQSTSTEEGEQPPFFGRFAQSGLSYPSRTNFAGFLQDRIIIKDSMLLTGGVRLERNGSFGTYVLPRAALSWTLGTTMTLKASAGMGLKEPSLEQSYGGNFRVQGNPDLLPERSLTFDAGIVQYFSEERFFMEATVFRHEYQDQIVRGNLDVPTLESALPEFNFEEMRQIREEIRAGLREPIRFEIDFDRFRPSYINLGKSRAQGLELSFGAAPVFGMQFRADYTFLDGLVLESTDRGIEEGSSLPNRPRHQFVLNGQSEIGRVTLGGTLLYVGERLADIDFISRALDITTLDAYTRVDARATFRLSPRFELYVVSENLLDAEYMEVLGYPALGRSIRGGVRFDLSF